MSESNATDIASDINWNWNRYEIVPEYYDRVHEAHKPLAMPAERILEVGVGCGYVLSKLRRERKNSHCVGLDYDPAAIELSRRVGGEADVTLALVRGDGTSLPFANASFDFVYSVGVIEHFDVPAADGFLGEHLRVVRPGGIVAISVPNKWNLFHTFLKWKLGPKYPYYPERSYSPLELANLLRRHGLTIEGRDGWVFFWSLWHMPWRWYYYLSAASIRMGFDHTFESRYSPIWRSRFGMMTMVWGRRSRDG